jgi:hypothetical protein
MSDAYPDGGLGHVCADKRKMRYFCPAVNKSRENNCHNVTPPRNRSDRSGLVREVLVPSIAKKIHSLGGSGNWETGKLRNWGTRKLRVKC